LQPQPQISSRNHNMCQKSKTYGKLASRTFSSSSSRSTTFHVVPPCSCAAPTPAVAPPQPSRASTSHRAPSSSPVPAAAPKPPAGSHRERGRQRCARGAGKGLAAAWARPRRRAATAGAWRRRRRCNPRSPQPGAVACPRVPCVFFGKKGIRSGEVGIERGVSFFRCS